MSEESKDGRTEYGAQGEEAIRELFAELADTQLMRVAQELHNVKDSPRLCVILTHGMVDLMVNTLIEAKCKKGKRITKDHRTYPHSAKLTLLYEMGVLDDHHFRLLDWFRDMRNDAAHEVFFEVTEAKLSVFANPQQREVKNFANTCWRILYDLWKTYEDVIGPAFVPSLYETKQTPVLLVEVPAPKYRLPLVSDPSRISMKHGDLEKHYERYGDPETKE